MVDLALQLPLICTQVTPVRYIFAAPLLSFSTSLMLPSQYLCGLAEIQIALDRQLPLSYFK